MMVGLVVMELFFSPFCGNVVNFGEGSGGMCKCDGVCGGASVSDG